MTGKFHRPTPASVRNAFERDDTPTVFSSRKELGRQQAQEMNRIRYVIRFAYWAIRHRSISCARWVMDYEGKNWK